MRSRPRTARAAQALRLAIPAVFAAVAVFAPGRALAKPSAELKACAEDAAAGQDLRDAHHIVEALERFRACARQECPDIIRRDCTAWADDAERRTATVVLAAKDGSGRYVSDVRVTVDGAPFASALDGAAVAMNPGRHTFHFEAPDGTAADLVSPVNEGEKGQRIVGILVARVGEPTAAAAAPGATRPNDAPGATRPTATSPSSAPWRTVGWSVGALGVVGLGLGTVFGLMVASDKSDAHCDAAGLCDSAPLASARTHATLSTIAFVAGAALVAGGVTLVILAPSGPAQGSGMAVRGSW